MRSGRSGKGRSWPQGFRRRVGTRSSPAARPHRFTIVAGDPAALRLVARLGGLSAHPFNDRTRCGGAYFLRTTTQPIEYPAPNEQITPSAPFGISSWYLWNAMIEPADEVLA
jgi:hypothetical protein